MKKTRKVLLALLSVLTISSFSLGVASCEWLGNTAETPDLPPVNMPWEYPSVDNSSSQTTENEFRQVYATYVAYAKEQGSTPLSYEEWLKSIRGEKGDKGEKGDDGKDGIDGQDGKDGIDGVDGKDGVGIEKVEFDKDGNLVITFTDGTTQTVEMPKQETHVHTFGEWTAFTDEDTPCENRLFFRTCSDCKSIEWKQGSYADHDWNIVTTSPTCQAKGYDTKTCTVCGKIEVDNYTDKVDHDWKTEYSYDNSYHWHVCTMCDSTKDKAEHTPDESGECSVCGELVGATEGVLYDVSTDGTYAEVIGYEGTATEVKIADTYNGLPVTNIYEMAFYQNETITSVIIPDSITSIGMGAFYYCNSLTSITIGDSVTSIGTGLFGECSNLTSVTIGNSVTSIGEATFYRCFNLTNITIGNSVTSIGMCAFQSCNSLTSITIPDSVTSIGSSAFSGCSSLTSVTIGDGVTSIGEAAFSICSRLTSIKIPDSVTSIGTGAFEYCRHLTSITIPDSVTSIGAGAFQACIKLVEVINKSSLNITKGSSDNGEAGYYALHIHNGDVSKISNQDGYQFITDENGINYLLGYTGTETILVLPNNYNGEEYRIYKYAFREFSDLTSVTIGDSVTSIGTYAFGYCSSLTSVTISDSVTSIEEMAFWDCSGLTSITIGDSVTSIGANAFGYCSGLTNVNIPNSVTSIGEWAFIGCSGLTSITASENNTAYKSIDGNLYTKDGTELIQYAIGKTDSSFVIPDSVTSIGSYAFSGCRGLTSVTIPDSVTSIGRYAFAECSNLVFQEYENCQYLGNENNPYFALIQTKNEIYSYTIHENTKLIAGCAFSYCVYMDSIVIPNSVTSIGSSAFEHCSQLTSVYYKGTAEDWAKISIENSGNDYLMKATRYHYNETTETPDETPEAPDETPTMTIPEFYGAKLLLENDAVYIVIQGNYKTEGTVEEAAAIIKDWFNNCMERGTWNSMEYTVDVTMKEDKSFTVKLNVKEMKNRTHYWFHIGNGEYEQDFTCSFAEDFIPVSSAGTNTANKIDIPEGGASYVETSDGTKYYLGIIQNWDSKPLFICSINENSPDAPEVTGADLEIADGYACLVLTGTVPKNLSTTDAEAAVLKLVPYLDLQTMGTWLLPNGEAHIQDGAYVMWGEEKDANGNVVTAGTQAAKITYNAEGGTFKIYAAITGENVVDGTAFFCSYGASKKNMKFDVIGSVTANGLVFKFATGEELGYSESDWQYNITYITVSDAE